MNGHSRRVDAISRRLTDPEKEITIWDTYRAIEELEADPNRSHILGMPRDRLNALVEVEIVRLEKLLGER